MLFAEMMCNYSKYISFEEMHSLIDHKTFENISDILLL